MKVQMYEDGGLGIVNLSTPGVAMTGFLIPSNDDYDDLFLTRKSYVDSAFSNLDTQTITTGTLSFDTIKSSISGDVSVTPTNTVALNSSIGVGTFTKVTVNAKGLVTLGSILGVNDIPDFGWEKLTALPTTAAGYGITDALLNTGGTVTGNITLAGGPVQSTDAVTKSYVDTAMTELAANYINTGDIIYKLSTPTPTGYLRCNGAYISRTTYAALYAYLGSSYNHPTDTTLFSLPDLTTLDSQGYTMFIKT